MSNYKPANLSQRMTTSQLRDRILGLRVGHVGQLGMTSGPYYSQIALNADVESTVQGLWTLSWEVFLYRNIRARQENTISKAFWADGE